MSIVPKETIEVIAQSIGISNLSQDVALALAPDVEYRMREIMQEAIKCMRHSRRTTLTTDDVDSALNLRNVEPIYGFTCNDPLRFKKAVGHKGLFYIDDKDLDFREVIDAPLPKAPLDTTVVCHWLAIEGIQPAIPENASVEVISTPPDTKKTEQKDDELPVDIRLPVKHVLSRELQLYFDKITELTMSRSDSTLFKEALQSLAIDSGLHPLVPYFTCFVADEVSRGLSDFRLLFALMRLVHSLLYNPHIHVEPYLHQLMPSVVTCLVAKKLGNRLTDNHWELREFSANLVASICKRFGHVYNNLQTRLTRTLVHAFLDPKRTLTQHYGAIQGLASLGPNVVRLLLLPNLETYLKLLEPELFRETQQNEVKRYEAWRVYGALQRAAGQCIFERLKLFPMLIPPPSEIVMRNAGRINCTKEPKAIKRKASTDLDEEQPPQKKLATDGPPSEVLSTPNNNLPSEIQGTTNTNTNTNTATATATATTSTATAATTATAINNSVGAGPSTSPLTKPSTVSESVVALARNKGGMVEVLKISAMLNQVWKDDLKSGQLPAMIVDQFGERILHPFIPTSEKNFFI